MPYLYDDALDDQLLYERIELFGGGMDAYQRSTLLAPNQSQYLENVLIPDNLEARTRPGADSLGGTGPSPANATQGLFYFDTAQPYQQLITAANKHFYKWEGAAWAAMNGANELVLNDATLMFEAAQGIDKLLVTDGVQQMQTWDGAAWSLPLGNTPNDPPVGCSILCWHTGRMFAAGHGVKSDTIWVSARLAYGTGNWNTVQRSFRVGGGEGDPIMAMASMQSFTLAVLKRNSIWICVTDPRNEPGDFSTQQASETLSYGIGCVGRKAWCVYGNDLLFMARDGVRSLQRMQAAAGQYQLSAPISEPLQPYIDRINWAFASKICARKYKEFALFAVPLDNNTSNSAVLVWNGRLACWVGIWTGWAPNAFESTRFSGVSRLVLGEGNGRVRQWKDFSDKSDDATYTEDGAGIASKVWTRSLLFGEPVNDKDGYHAEVRFSTSNALVNVTAVADNDDLRTWTHDLRQTGVDLPVDLPVDLGSSGAVLGRRGLRGARPFNEVFLKIESKQQADGTYGWWALKNVSLSAFLNTLRNQ